MRQAITELMLTMLYDALWCLLIPILLTWFKNLNANMDK